MIPKLIHLCWTNKDILNVKSPLVEEGIKNVYKLNPEWVIDISTDNDIDDYLKERLNCSDYNLIKKRHIVSKSDLWRLFKIYECGGVYIDVDRLVNIPFCQIITEGIKWVLPYNNRDFSHDLMISSPLNPVFKLCIEMYIERIKAGCDNTYFLGPQTYMHAIISSLFNKLSNENYSFESLNKMAEIINQVPFIKCSYENPPQKTILYNGKITAKEHEEMKRSLYKQCGLKHWTGEW